MSELYLYTIGYENKTPENFIELLTLYNVKTLVDVRELPYSHKKGFSKTPLSKLVEDNGIHYIHIREVGSPRELRDELKKTQNYDKFFAKYDEYLATQGAALSEITRLAHSSHTCLMCVEANPNKCHRSRIALKVKEADGNGLKIKDLRGIDDKRTAPGFGKGNARAKP
jgi:uncharacterized protein (DUF488 family)